MNFFFKTQILTIFPYLLFIKTNYPTCIIGIKPAVFILFFNLQQLPDSLSKLGSGLKENHRFVLQTKHTLL